MTTNEQQRQRRAELERRFPGVRVTFRRDGTMEQDFTGCQAPPGWRSHYTEGGVELAVPYQQRGDTSPPLARPRPAARPRERAQRPGGIYVDAGLTFRIPTSPALVVCSHGRRSL